ncbi:SAP domain-containing ribonucleoprotein-like isoform X1 [Acanthaster planci]|uniref:SAP domain-containing ribonucleoprotein-like isoform X1 n=1 Tax=Acanthaster planci TaxID=133434 RepID=A0A8B7XT93_ACAPL|nr:SAP domain-containing ribonucleoprotein-like isoform X1 [Acanthaster planci]
MCRNLARIPSSNEHNRPTGNTMDLKKLKIPELKKELTSRGLALKGNKQELVNRLSQYLEENDEAILDNGTEPTDAILTSGVEEDLLAQEDEPNLLDDEEEEPAVAETVAKVTSPIALQRKPVLTASQAKPSAPVVAAQKITTIPATTSELTPAEKKALRAQRFNTPLSEEARKQARLEKFGGKQAVTASAGAVPKTQGKVSAVSSDALEKLKKRSERFGTAVSPIVQKTDEMERLLKRKQRFGVITNTTTAAAVKATGTRRISTGGGGDDVEAKKKKRAERFGLS